ncbi:tyrosine-type recombinase/integrase [Cohnella sp. WQ 127256]|uniref:tyrosine-type recombinase/integrase n=1 Tax=Cohnella sp. WQ 127256 TaxID=2938790 RepID=UPI003556E399
MSWTDHSTPLLRRLYGLHSKQITSSRVTAGNEFHALYTLAEATGMRRGEMLALQWPDIDFDNSRLAVNKYIKYTVVKGTFVSFTKKTKQQKNDHLTTVCD